MKKRFSSVSTTNATSHVRLSARGMRKNFYLHVDSGYQSKTSSEGTQSASGTGWVLAEENARFTWSGVGTAARWGDYVKHSTLVELSGILDALETIKNNHYGIIHPTNHISIYCDNDAVQRIMRLRLNENKFSNMGHEIVEKIVAFQNLVHLDFQWEKGHSTNILNNIADKLSFFVRKDLETFHGIGAFHLDLMVLEVLRKAEQSDYRLSEHILHIDRRQELCRDHKSVELSFTVNVNGIGQREAEWFALSGHGYHMGSFKLPARRGGMEMASVATEVLEVYRSEVDHNQEHTVLLNMPDHRGLLDEVFSAHRNKLDASTMSHNKAFKMFKVMKNSLDSMKIRFIQENQHFKGMAVTIWED